MRIKGPRRQGKYPDRQLDCEDAIEGFYLSMIEWAEAAGWSRREAIMASVSVAEIVLTFDVENGEVLHAIQAARRSRMLN